MQNVGKGVREKNTIIDLSFEYGLTKDVSGNNRTVTLINSPATTTGKFNTCGDFSLSNCGLKLNANSAYSLATTDKFTIEFWFKLSTASSGQASTYAINNTGIGFNSGLAFITMGYNTADAYVTHGSSALISPFFGAVPGTTAWHHFLATHTTSSAVQYYIDGYFRHSNAFSGFTESTADNYIFAYKDNSYWGRAYIDNFKIIKGIAKNFQAGTPTVGTQYFTPPTVPYR